MKYLFSQKILLLQPYVNRKKKSKKGTMTLVSVFLYFIFSSLGLSMLYLSQIYLKISAYKKNSIILDYATENGIKLAFNHLLCLLSQTDSPFLLSPLETDELRNDTRNNGLKIVKKLFGKKIPLQHSQNWENLGWESTTNFSLEKIEEKEDYFIASYKATINSEGKIKNFKHKKESSLEALLGVSAGNLPLPYIPLLLDKNVKEDKKENFSKENKITFLPTEKNPISPQIGFSEGDLIPENADSQLQKALKIKFFYPQNISTPLLRVVLGLEKTNEPVPDGVYLIKDNLGLGGIFVQGNLEEMIVAIDGDFQVVSFLSDSGFWILKYNPYKIKTTFITPEEIFDYDLIPLGIILVNGEIRSLGGGEMDPSGKPILVTEKEIPSILRGINLTIISSDKVTLTSHLIHQGVKWMDRVPYIKDSNSQLNIFATGKEFFGNKEKEGKIIIGNNSPAEIKIQASLTASGKGFSIEGEKKNVHILGSLQTSDYSSNKNSLNFTYEKRFPASNPSVQNAPQTAKPVLCFSFFKILEWKEF